MPAHRAISSEAIIGKIYRDYRHHLTSSSWTYDAIEWIGDAVKAIKAYYGLEHLALCAQVKQCKVALPCRLEQLEGIEYNGCRLPRTNNVDFKNPCKALTGKPIHPDAKYQLNPGYIQTNFDEGEIIIYYLGIPIDCHGFPMIPDQIDYKEAISAYIIFRLLTSGHKIADFNWREWEERWERKRYEARNRVDFPDIDDMEAFARTWVSPLIDTRKVQRFFSEYGRLGTPESNIYSGFSGPLSITAND